MPSERLPEIRTAAVLGAGVMGAGIAAHLANVGMRVLLLDLPVEGPDRSARARGALKAVQKAKPAAFYDRSGASRISVGNFDDDLPRLAEVDWVIEAVLEDVGVKSSLYERVSEHLSDAAILSSNTSGLSVGELSAALPESLRPRFLVTHFFNPPRYLELLEIVRGPETSDAVVERIEDVCERVLGKGVVHAKDTPNFIANRIGCFAVFHAIRFMEENGYTVPEIDALTGPLLGRPKSATFRTADIVGLDTLALVAGNLYERLPDGEREQFAVPAFMRRMIEAGMLGAKTRKGFYEKRKHDGRTEILAIDPATLEHGPSEPPQFESVAALRRTTDLGERLRALVGSDDRAGAFVRANLDATLRYAASCIPEIADDVASVDQAMRWGFGWEMGPFEMWDALGVAETADRLRAAGEDLPPLVEWVLGSERASFYGRDDAGRVAFDISSAAHVAVPSRAEFVVLDDLRAGGGVVAETDDAALIDLGDGVLCLEFRTKLNTIGVGLIDAIHHAIDATESNWRGLVVGNDAKDFCVGANLLTVLTELEAGHTDEVRRIVGRFQSATRRMRDSSRPVVVAPRGLALGGGCEIVLGADAVCAAAETYTGLVEVGVGLIPAGGGCAELICRLHETIPDVSGIDLFPHVRRIFETVGMATVSTSGPNAREIGYLRDVDRITVSRRRLLHDAKQLALSMDAAGYTPPPRRDAVRVVGETGLAALRLGISHMRRAGYITEYDVIVGEQLAWVLCGGAISATERVSEAYLLELEVEAFMALCAEDRTRARMKHVLETGKPLRN